jgi:predicted Kef-type K+ transport protein
MTSSFTVPSQAFSSSLKVQIILSFAFSSSKAFYAAATLASASIFCYIIVNLYLIKLKELVTNKAVLVKLPTILPITAPNPFFYPKLAKVFTI